VYPAAVHDEDCILRVEPFEVVHRRFLTLLRAHVRTLMTVAEDGTCRAAAERVWRLTRIEIMGHAVIGFGPRWPDPTMRCAHAA
jgi:hypothetical protein